MSGRTAISATAAVTAAVAVFVVTPALGTPGPPVSIGALGGADGGSAQSSWSTGTDPAGCSSPTTTTTWCATSTPRV